MTLTCRGRLCAAIGASVLVAAEGSELKRSAVGFGLSGDTRPACGTALFGTTKVCDVCA